MAMTMICLAVFGVLPLFAEFPVFAAETHRLKRSDDVPALQTIIEGLSQQMNDVNAKLTAMRNELDAIQTNVAFHAHHSSDPFSVAAHGHVIYDVVNTNIGNAYNPRSGIFTAPVSGTYVFFANCMAVSSTSEEVYIMIEDKTMAGCYSWQPSGSPIDQGATMATVHVQAGQQVWIRLLENAENVRGGPWNTFSGFLVKADS